jgi:hypothetical protein
MASCPDEGHVAADGGQVRLRVLDTDLTVLCDRPAADAVTHLYAPFPSPAQDATTTVVHANGLTATAAQINALALAGVGNLAVHAGAVALDGSVVAFPAASGAGKTTLTAACLLAGLRYVSDEALCLDWQDGSVRPYPRPLALSPWSAGVLGLDARGADELLVTAGDLGAPVARAPLRLRHVVLIDPPGAEPGLRPAPRSAGAAELLRRSFTHWHHPDRAFELVHQVLAEVSVWRLSRSSPQADAAAVAALLGTPLSDTPTADPAGPGSAPSTQTAPSAPLTPSAPST